MYTEACKALRKVLKSNTEENEAEDMDNRQQTLLPDFPKLVAYIQDKVTYRNTLGFGPKITFYSADIDK